MASAEGQRPAKRQRISDGDAERTDGEHIETKAGHVKQESSAHRAVVKEEEPMYLNRMVKREEGDGEGDVKIKHEPVNTANVKHESERSSSFPTVKHEGEGSTAVKMEDDSGENHLEIMSPMEIPEQEQPPALNPSPSTAEVMASEGRPPSLPDVTCRMCGKSLKSLDGLNAHIACKHGAPPQAFQCRWCTKSFADDRRLDRHCEQMHSDKKPFECAERQCRKRFATVKQRRQHMQTQHAVVRKCPESGCSETFKRALRLDRHLAAVHHKKPPFKCARCGLSHWDQAELDEHNRVAHGGRSETKRRVQQASESAKEDISLGSVVEVEPSNARHRQGDEEPLSPGLPLD